MSAASLRSALAKRPPFVESANALAKEHGVDNKTATAILRKLGYELTTLGWVLPESLPQPNTFDGLTLCVPLSLLDNVPDTTEAIELINQGHYCRAASILLALSYKALAPNHPIVAVAGTNTKDLIVNVPPTSD